MKRLTSIIIFLFTINLHGQEIEEIKVRILKIDTSQIFYNYYTFDSLTYPKRNLIVLKKLWVDKQDSLTTAKLNPDNHYTIIVGLIGPEKGIWQGDTIHFRGHLRNFINYIDGHKIINNNQQKKDDFKPEDAAIKIEYYELKEIKNGG